MKTWAGHAGSVGPAAWRGLATLGAALTVALAAGPVPGYAQSLADRVRAAAPAPVTFSIELRDEVEVCERGNVRMRSGDEGRIVMGDSRDDGRRCVHDRAHVRVDQDAEGRPTRLELLPGPPGGDARSLGAVPAAQAADYLFGLAEGGAGATERAMRNALMATTLLRGVDPAPRLLALASDHDAPPEARKTALFWVAQVAAGRISTELAGIAAHEAEDQEVRDAAVFALSQRPDGEAVPALADLARTAPHVKTRRSALFWLAQSDDPRVAELFADLILRGPLGGG